jgi:hypothetical protein
LEWAGETSISKKPSVGRRSLTLRFSERLVLHAAPADESGREKA